MNIQEVIAKKRDKQKLNKEEIEFFIKEYTNGSIADYQAAALIMAIYINGMDMEETVNLTLSMANSGDILDLSELGTVVDKHSTGGVGDKVTLILAPIIASIGIPVAKMSGRGLGYTGGTIDKLEAIPGYRTNISEEEFMQNVKKIGISIIGQTLNLAPADKKIYALRDATNTTASVPLIASSIMSKKIAAGANKIVLDVTYGSGAFMKTKEEAKELADTMTEIGKLAGRETVAVITPMEEPLGRNIGNSLEVIEAVEALKGNMAEDVKEVVLELGSNMIKLAGKGDNLEENKAKMLENISNGLALEKLKELVSNQDGDVAFIENTSKFKKAKYIMPVMLDEKIEKMVNQGEIKKQDIVVKELNAEEIGKISVFLGGGRTRKEDKIDDAEQFPGFFYRNPVYGNPLCFILSKMYINLMYNTVLFNPGTDMSFFFVKRDHLSVFGASVGFCRAAYIGRFQNIRFSLSIIAVKNISIFIKLQIQAFIIAKILKAHGFYDHNRINSSLHDLDCFSMICKLISVVKLFSSLIFRLSVYSHSPVLNHYLCFHSGTYETCRFHGLAQFDIFFS